MHRLRTLVMLVVCLTLAASLPGCGGGRKRVSMSHTSRNFAVVKARPADTLKTLANRYLKDPSKDWVIKEYNGIDEIVPGQIVVIPTRPVDLGGLEENSYQTVPMLAYSAFSPDMEDALTIDEASFREQMQYLEDNGYTPVSMDLFYDFLEFKEQLPDKAVVLTIDDVGQHTYDIAFKVLQEFGFTATIFVTTDLVTGKGAALSWDQVREMRDAGMTIGHRTKTLRNLTRRKTDESFEDFIIAIDREFTVASLTLRSELEADPAYFAYPYGATNELVLSLLEKNGFRGAVTLEKGTNPFFVHNYLVRRNAVPGNMTLENYAGLFSFRGKEAVQ